ncbi:MAG: hypothetical protein RLZZ165_2437 [Bacteroidota bacterium]|jgi:hypothetical protein
MMRTSLSDLDTTSQVSCQACGAEADGLRLVDIIGQVVLLRGIELRDGAGAARIDISDIAADVYSINVNDLV